jgi:hypothetical protein
LAAVEGPILTDGLGKFVAVGVAGKLVGGKLVGDGFVKGGVVGDGLAESST